MYISPNSVKCILYYFTNYDPFLHIIIIVYMGRYISRGIIDMMEGKPEKAIEYRDKYLGVKQSISKQLESY